MFPIERYIYSYLRSASTSPYVVGVSKRIRTLGRKIESCLDLRVCLCERREAHVVAVLGTQRLGWRSALGPNTAGLSCF